MSPPGTAVRKTRWLPALEKELKSRVGWVDEAVSPFAAETRAAQAAAKIQDAFQPAKPPSWLRFWPSQDNRKDKRKGMSAVPA